MYLIRERFFALGEDSDITDEQGRPVLHVDGKVLSLRNRLVLRGPDGREVAQVQRKLVAMRPTYQISVAGREAAEVRKRFFTPFGDRFTIDVPGPDDLEMRGNLFDHEFTISRGLVSHRPHHGRPPNPQVTGHRGHRMGVLPDPPTGLGAGPLGQHHWGADHLGLLGPGPDAAGGLSAAPDPLAPGQHHRPVTDRQVTHPDSPAAMQGGAHAAACAADHRRRGLDLELPLATHHLGGEDLEAVQAEQPGG
jgi:uncharacterized protein YxjI